VRHILDSLYLIKSRQSDSLKKSQLTLSQGILKKRNDGDDEVDDEMRITVPSQNRISREVWEELDGHINTSRHSQLCSQIPARLPCCRTGFSKLYNSLETGDDE
jgi:hypothetical protein